MKSGTDWKSRIRPDHPRIFINGDTLPAIRALAAGGCNDHYLKVRSFAESTPEMEWAAIDRPPPLPDGTEVRDWGHRMMCSAIVHLVEPSADRLTRLISELRASAEYYHACYAEDESVNWYAASRAACLVTLDWIWNELVPEDRREIGLRLLDHVDEALHKPGIRRRNGSDHRSGFYGAPSLAWFAGLLLYGEGIDDDRAARFLDRGHDDHIKLLDHRAAACGDDGGEASPTLGYAFGEYPLAQWNFIHTLESSTGEDISEIWPHIRMFPNYVIWNWLPGDLEFGYGDNAHTDNRMRTNWMYTHMSHIMHFFGGTHPEWAGLARYIRDMAGGGFAADKWPIYPFLLDGLDIAPPARGPGILPPARHFENLGHIFMRSGSSDDDTYALFCGGGSLRSHRHYDATHFTIFKNGFLALDSGTRQGNTDNLQNYYAQTVAHNCVLIKMPGEAPSPYWNGEVYGQAGGQNNTIGSVITAFETNPEFTYVAADATPVYNAEKCALMVRQFIFLPPDHFVVFDRVTSTCAGYAKTWLLHHANEPVVDGASWRSDQHQGRIIARTLLPEDAVLEKVGGPGREFLADGVNYAIDEGPSRLIVENKYPIGRMQYDEIPELMGRWRMEVRPGTARKEDLFLHLIQVGDRNLQRMDEADVSVSRTGVELDFIACGSRVVISFAASGKTAGHITCVRNGERLADKDLAVDVQAQAGLAA